ncbi:MAG: fibronectin type III domain-containing protein [Nitrospirales bacterium]
MRILTLLALLVHAGAGLAMAEGTQYNGTCASISWAANTESDLAGYRLYDRTSTTSSKNLMKTYGLQTTSATCASLGLNAGQHYFSLTSYDTSGNESPATVEVPFVIVPSSVNAVTNLRVTIVNATDMSIAWTEVDDGTGAPAKYDVRFATPTVNWGTAASVTSGTCSNAVAGTTIGATKTCTITGLAATTAYQYQAVPYRGTQGVDSVYGPLSNITGATTGGAVPSPTRTTLAGDSFTRADGSLGAPWVGSYTPQQDMKIVSNAVRPATAGGQSAHMTYNTTTPANQWGTMTITTIQGAGAVVARIDLRYAASPTNSGYVCLAYRNVSGVVTEIIRKDAGATVVLATTASGSWASGDQLDCEIQGSTIILSKISGGVTTVLLTVSDATYSAGLVGMGVYASTEGDGVIDTFSAGGFSAAVVTDPCGCDHN